VRGARRHREQQGAGVTWTMGNVQSVGETKEGRTEGNKRGDSKRDRQRERARRKRMKEQKGHVGGRQAYCLVRKEQVGGKINTF
jgi:hypothetical protein